ncbi:MAG: hypothetical protein J6W47_02245, partial [Bacteroidales bacterium]|nr:hypothetical protein [Bacteroidales bacterium]
TGLCNNEGSPVGLPFLIHEFFSPSGSSEQVRSIAFRLRQSVPDISLYIINVRAYARIGARLSIINSYAFSGLTGNHNTKQAGIRRDVSLLYSGYGDR